MIIKRTVFDVGYIGNGKYLPHKNYKCYANWKNMLSRCYNIQYIEKHISYINCIVCDEWHNFQNFAKWHEENYIKNFHLDKDLKINGNKIYSPLTCVYIPQWLNTLFNNNLKENKSLEIGVRKTSSGKFCAVCNNGEKQIWGKSRLALKEAKIDYLEMKNNVILKHIGKKDFPKELHNVMLSIIQQNKIKIYYKSK